MMPKKTQPNRLGIAIAVVAIAVIAGLFWVERGRHVTTESTPHETVATAPAQAVPAPGDSVRGAMTVSAPARDPQLGVSVDAPLLLRYVEMLQWTEKCVAEKCAYSLVWSPQVIKSANFREKAGHDNPLRLPFAIARFVAPGVAVDGVRIDALAYGAHRYAEQPFARPKPLDVDIKQLPPNLAINFRAVDGKLYAGNDPAKPVAGDLRITYRTFPVVSEVKLTGTRTGDRLLPLASSAEPKVQLPPQKP